MTQTYVEFMYPGSFFSETESKLVTSRRMLLADVPRNAFGYSFYDLESTILNGETLTGKPKNKSKIFLIGKPYTLDELRALFGSQADMRVLISNVERNKWRGAVLCRSGNWQPMMDTTEVVDPEVVHS